ncbi:MAG: thioesterase family protein [Actinobacteria bacterium]|nr:MAG: thioesterase family protein [Actinomycetota bacterium]
MSAEAVFLPVGDTTFLATELARGPWDPAAQHGGAPAALLMRAFERLRTSDELVLARVTYEFLRSVPLGELDVRSSVLRSGRRVQLLEASIFATMEIRFVAGEFSALGPSTGWFRLQVPLVAGESASPLQSLAAAADFGNGISSVVPWDDHLFINPDLTLYIERRPAGDWICLQAQTRISPGGVGIAESRVFDEQGQVGQATQALLVARR